MRHYRALFDELLDGNTEEAANGSRRPVVAGVPEEEMRR